MTKTKWTAKTHFVLISNKYDLTYSLLKLPAEGLDADGAGVDLFMELHNDAAVIIGLDTELTELAVNFPVGCGQLTSTALFTFQLGFQVTEL